MLTIATRATPQTMYRLMVGFVIPTAPVNVGKMYKRTNSAMRESIPVLITMLFGAVFIRGKTIMSTGVNTNDSWTPDQSLWLCILQYLVAICFLVIVIMPCSGNKSHPSWNKFNSCTGGNVGEQGPAGPVGANGQQGPEGPRGEPGKFEDGQDIKAGSLVVNSDATVYGPLTANNGLTVTGTAAVYGQMDANNGLRVTGGKGLDVSGDITAAGLTVGGGLYANDGLTVTGTAAVYGQMDANNGLRVTGTATVNGQMDANNGLTVSGPLTADGLKAADGLVTVTAPLTTGALTVTGPLSVDGLLTADGGTYGEGLVTVTAPLNANNGLTVTGGKGLDVSGDITAAGLTVSGQMDAYNGLTVTGALNANGLLNANNGLAVTGNATVGGGVRVGGLFVAEDGVDVTGNAFVSGDANLNVIGDANVDGALYVKDGLGVTGPLTANEGLTVTGGITVDGKQLPRVSSTIGSWITPLDSVVSVSVEGMEFGFRQVQADLTDPVLYYIPDNTIFPTGGFQVYGEYREENNTAGGTEFYASLQSLPITGDQQYISLGPKLDNNTVGRGYSKGTIHYFNAEHEKAYIYSFWASWNTGLLGPGSEHVALKLELVKG